MANSYTREQETAEIKVTNVGFVFGAATVTRVTTLPKGQVVIRVESDKCAINIRVCPSGKMIIANDAGVGAQFIPAAQAPKPKP